MISALLGSTVGKVVLGVAAAAIVGLVVQTWRLDRSQTAAALWETSSKSFSDELARRKKEADDNAKQESDIRRQNQQLDAQVATLKEKLRDTCPVSADDLRLMDDVLCGGRPGCKAGNP